LNWLRIRELVRKEFIQLFRDRKNRPLLLIMPLVQLILFGYVVSTDVRDIRVGIVDQSNTIESRTLREALDANPTFRIVLSLTRVQDLNQALLQRRMDLALVIPPDFSRQIRAGRTAEVQILADGSMSNMAAVRIAHTVTVLQDLNQRFLAELRPQRLEYGRIEGRIRTWYNPNLDSQSYYVPGIVAFLIMLLTLLFTSMAIIREKERGTMEQLIVTPLRPAELILGKTIPYIIIAQAQMVMVTAFAVWWFQVPMAGSSSLLLGAACLFLLSTLGIGLFISTISATQQQAMMTTFFFVVPFFMLSGFVFPIENMPLPVQGFTYLNPLRYFLVIIRGIFLKGVGLKILWPQYVALAVLGGFVFGGAVSRFKKRLD